MTYRQAIRETLIRHGYILNPGHVEAHMRAEAGGTLDRLSRSAFDALAIACIPNVISMTTEDNDDLARSYGCYFTEASA